MNKKHYDVFLSRKSEDAHLAKEIYDFLTEKGLKVFDSNHSLQEMGNADYSRAIDDALVNTDNLIVIGSSVENIISSWVEAEWRFFLNRKRSGKVNGNILTMITDSILIDDIPPSLQNYEILRFNKIEFLKILLYVKNPNFDLKRFNQSQSKEDGLLELEEGIKKLKDEKYYDAYMYFIYASEKGNNASRFYLGRIFQFGLGLEKDYEKSMNWFLSAAKNDFGPAQFQLSQHYLLAKGLEKNIEISNYWLMESAKNNYPPALIKIVYKYLIGEEPLERSIEKAKEWNVIYKKQKELQEPLFYEHIQDEHQTKMNIIGQLYMMNKFGSAISID